MEADDIAAIQQVFNKYCDKDGLMTKKALTEMSPFSDMLVSCIHIHSFIYSSNQGRIQNTALELLRDNVGDVPTEVGPTRYHCCHRMLGV